MARFEGTGTLSARAVPRDGLVGPAARAAGPGARRAHGLPGRAIRCSPGSGRDRRGGRRARARLRALARDRALAGLRPRAALGRWPEGATRAEAAALARRTASRSRSSRAGAARSATWRSRTATAASPTTRSSTRRSTTGSAWRSRPARPADLRLPALQQELQPLLLRARPVGHVHPQTCSPRALQAGPPHDRLPAGPTPRLPDRFRGLPRARAGRSAPAGCRACAEVCPTERDRRSSGLRRSTSAAASSAATA